ncbi:MAG: hypothetical protein ACQESM_07445, partial [Bacteroidota bacterium]
MHNLNSVAISGYSQKIINTLLSEQPKVSQIYQRSETYEDFERQLSEWAKEILQESEVGLAYYKEEQTGQTAFNRLRWQDFAAIRVLDYIDNTDREFEDKNLHGLKILNEPFRILYRGIKYGTGGGKPAFFQDM